MSKDSTPIHTSSPFDSYYDAAFSADISSKMRVPDKIFVEDFKNEVPIASAPKDEVRNMMNVPDRIIVAGDNKHIAVRDFVPELKFEKEIFPTTIPNHVLEAPPNVLTVDEYPYPSTEFDKSKDTKKKSVTREQPSMTMELNESSISSAPEDGVVMIRKQLRHLSRRVLALEQECQQRQQREIILYAVGIGYFILKGLIWLQRHF